jgi:hypothetical protein
LLLHVLIISQRLVGRGGGAGQRGIRSTAR